MNINEIKTIPKIISMIINGVSLFYCERSKIISLSNNRLLRHSSL